MLRDYKFEYKLSINALLNAIKHCKSKKNFRVGVYSNNPDTRCRYLRLIGEISDGRAVNRMPSVFWFDNNSMIGFYYPSDGARGHRSCMNLVDEDVDNVVRDNIIRRNIIDYSRLIPPEDNIAKMKKEFHRID